MQFTVISGLCAVLFYSLGTTIQGLNLSKARNSGRQVLALGLIAVVAHGISAIGVIRTASGYHFGISEISTLITVSISLLVLISSVRKPLQNLCIGLFPLAIVSIITSLTITSDYPPITMSAGLASHVVLSILAYSIISIAALQAGFLAFQNHQLKHGKLKGIIAKFPPLQDMEAFLFELLWVGQLLLSLGIAAGIVFLDDVWGRDGVIHKTFFSVLAWLVFAVLLWGRHQLGWRGMTAIRGTLIGFALLILGFYGSKFALEYMLG
ncbi:MAG: inner membrane protein YpjD [Pseudohongiellaceae bacterium]